MRILLIFGLYAFATLLAMTSPAYAAGLYLWNNIFQPLAFARYSGDSSTATFVVGVLVLSAAIAIARGKLKPRLNIFIVTIPLFMLWSFICAVHSPFPNAVANFILILKYVAPLILISAVVQKVGDIEKVAAVWMISVGIWSSQGGVKGLISGVTSTMSIPGGQMADNNDFMVGTVAAMPMMVYFFLNYKGRFKLPTRLICALMFLLSLSAVVFSNSRGATVGLGALMAFYIALLSRKKVRDVIILGIFLGITYSLLPDSFFDRIGTIEVGADQSEASAASRMALMSAAFSATLANPVFGVGPGCWLNASFAYIDDLHEPHDLWLKCSVENGVPGLIFYLLVVGSVLFYLFRLRGLRSRKEFLRASNLSIAIMAGIVGFVSAGTFTSHPYSEYLFALLGLGASLATNIKAQQTNQKLRAGTRKPLRRSDSENPGASPENPSFAPS